MSHRRLLLVFVVTVGLLLVVAACGRKGHPFLPEKTISQYVWNMQATWEDGYIILTGDLYDKKGPSKRFDMIQGCRVHYGQYHIENPPCPGCPVEYRGYHEFGVEVVAGGKFVCRVPGKRRGQIYFFKVHLLGPDGALGPPSNQVQVVVD